jgi:hypothetical protein
MTDSDLPPDLPKDESPLPPTPTAPRPGKSGWRIAAGVILCIVTLLLTLAMLPFSLCFGAMLQNSSSSSDAPWIIGLIILNILVPVGGTILAIRIFRGPKRLRPAAGVAGAPVSPPVPRASAQEIEERLTYLRLVILVEVFLHVASAFLSFTSNPKNITGLMIPVLAGFVLYQAPYLLALFGIRNQAESWAMSLAFIYPILAAFFSVIFFLTTAGLWHYWPASLVIRNAAFNLLGIVSDIVVVVFAWRAWQAAGRGSDSVLQLTLWGMGSAVYLLIVHFTTPLLYRLVHF